MAYVPSSNKMINQIISTLSRRQGSFYSRPPSCSNFARKLKKIMCFVYLSDRPAPMTHSYRLWLVTWKYKVRIPVGPEIFHHGCAYTVLQTVQRHGVYSGAYSTVHFKELLKSFRVGHSPGVGLPSLATLP